MPALTLGGPASPWLLDDFVEAYVRWREECDAVSEAYERWTGADLDDRSLAFAAYSAAVDREERAAREYHECTNRVRRHKAR